MSVLKKLMQARLMLQEKELKKTGENTYAGYMYFTLGDFLPEAQRIFDELGLCGIVSFTADIASLTITDLDDGSSTVITSPMGSASLKGCHEVQNIGAVETYQRRYLWVAAFEIVEHDILDGTHGKATATKGTKAKPTDGVWDGLDDEAKAYLLKVAAAVLDIMPDAEQAHTYLEGLQLDSEEKIAVWSKLDSKTRTALKKVADQLKKAQ